MRWLAVTVSLLAIAGCENTNRNSPLTSSPDLRIADAALASGMPETALEVTREILQEDPRNTGALMRQGERSPPWDPRRGRGMLHACWRSIRNRRGAAWPWPRLAGDGSAA